MAADIGGRACTVAGCGSRHYGRGMCRAHHARWLRTGDPGPAQVASRPPRDATCTVEGCGQPHEARGYCRTHYSRWQRTGDVRPTTPPNPRVCKISGCQQRCYGRGMCPAHYRRWRRAGGTLPGLDITECGQLYRDGASAAGLGRLYGLAPRTVLAALRAAHVQIRPPGQLGRGHTR
ncbi:MAG: hypothetical protein ACRDS9_24985 [Pseudonocardiaceae bacterium]